MRNFLSSLIQALLRKYPLLTPIVLACFLSGIGIGAVCARNLNTDLLQQAKTLILQTQPLSFPELLLQVFTHSLLPLLLLFLAAWSAIGMPFCLLLTTARGFSIGFLFCLVVRQWGNRGILLIFSVLFPRTLIELPILLLFCIFSCGISASLFKVLFTSKEQLSKPTPYLLLFLTLILFETLWGCGFEYLQQIFVTHFVL